MTRLGFIGTGGITEAIIGGLLAAPDAAFEIIVSPRSEARSRALAAAYPQVTRARSNADVVESCDIVFLAVRPQQADVLAGLPFRAAQIVVSLMAGISVPQVNAMVAPAVRVVRVVPLPCIRLGKGPILMTPKDDVVAGLFARLGDLIAVEDEADLAAMSAASGLMSSYFELQNTGAAWLEGRGVPSTEASLYMRSLFLGLGAVGLASAKVDEAVIPRDYETPGGLNEAGRAHLMSVGWFDEAAQALDAIEARAHALATRS